nr:immunoglobulin heavy chain junction region [Mus musculus]
TVQDGPLTS